jgi:hypothetical protein
VSHHVCRHVLLMQACRFNTFACASSTQRTDVDAPPFNARAWRKNPLEDEVQYAVLAVLRKRVVPGVLQETVLASHRQRFPPLDPCHHS